MEEVEEVPETVFIGEGEEAGDVAAWDAGEEVAGDGEVLAGAGFAVEVASLRRGEV